jgi:LemA protein
LSQILLYSFIAGLVVVVIAIGAVFNGLVRRRNRVDTTWSDVDVLLRRRHDLVPNLVAAVQGYAGHESATFHDVAEARTAAINATDPKSASQAEAHLAEGMKTLIALGEAYPQLKASATYVDLQGRLTATEDGLAHARQFYNDAVYGYNTAVQTLPGVLLAGPLGFHVRQFFQATPREQAAVAVRT